MAAMLLQDGEHGNHALQPGIDIGVAAGVVPRFGKRCTEMIPFRVVLVYKVGDGFIGSSASAREFGEF